MNFSLLRRRNMFGNILKYILSCSVSISLNLLQDIIKSITSLSGNTKVQVNVSYALMIRSFVSVSEMTAFYGISHWSKVVKFNSKNFHNLFIVQASG